VLVVAAAVFLVVFGLLAYCVVKFRKRADDDGREPAQVYGSNQVELAWTVIPILIVVTWPQLSVTASEFQQRRAAMRRHKVSRRTDGTGYPNQRRHQALRECLDPAGSR
jgi:heme/copper-type cytochrome/quinol oxidase subunit 2